MARKEVLLKVVRCKEGHTDMHLNCEVQEALGIAMSILMKVSDEIGIDYNSLLEDMKEIKKDNNNE